MVLSSLERIEGIRGDIKKLRDEREINIPEARESISNMKAEYDSLLKKEGQEYCNKNCPDIPLNISKISRELGIYKV
jgi:hypothetical protein